LSLQVWNSSNTRVCPWQVKIQKKKQKNKKAIQAHSGIVVSAYFFGEQKLHLAFKNLHTVWLLFSAWSSKDLQTSTSSFSIISKRTMKKTTFCTTERSNFAQQQLQTTPWREYA
jgi:hypothetical protein